jgi:hypothetical protein
MLRHGCLHSAIKRSYRSQDNSYLIIEKVIAEERGLCSLDYEIILTGVV